MRKAKVILSVLLVLIMVLTNAGAAFAQVQMKMSITEQSGSDGLLKNFDVTLYSDQTEEAAANAELAGKSVNLELQNSSGQAIRVLLPKSTGAAISSFGTTYHYSHAFTDSSITRYKAVASMLDTSTTPSGVTFGDPLVRNFDAGPVEQVPQDIDSNFVNYGLNSDGSVQFGWNGVGGASYYEVRGISNNTDLANYYNIGTFSGTGTNGIPAADLISNNVNYIYIVAYGNDDVRISRSAPVALRWISGSVSLPAGDTASEDINVSIHAERMWGGSDEASQTVTLQGTPSEGGSISAGFKLLIPRNDDPNLTLRYQIEGDNDVYVNSAYIGNGFTTTRYDDRKLISFQSTEGEIGGQDLQLIRGKLITGTLSYPDGQACVNAGTKIRIESRNNYWEGASTEIILPLNATQQAFKLVVPAASSLTFATSDSNQYMLFYNLDMGVDTRYVNRGFCTADGMTAYQGLAEKLDSTTGEEITGKNLTLMPGQVISGSVSFNAADALKDDVWVDVSAEADGVAKEGSDRYWQNVSFNISKATPTHEYTITVPKNGGMPGYKVKAHVNWDTGFVMDTLYQNQNGAPGYTLDYDLATKLTAGDYPIKNINFNLIPGTLVSGNVYRMNSDQYVEAGIEAFVTLEDSKIERLGYSGISMGPNQTQAEYFLVVPKAYDQSGLKFRYTLDTNRFSGYAREGYLSYNNNVFNTKYDIASASSLDVNNMGGKNRQMDFDLLPGRQYKIQGIINMPQTESPIPPVHVRIEAKNPDNGDVFASQDVTLTSTAGTQYTLTYTENDRDCIVTYTILNEDTLPFYQTGIYGESNDTTWDWDKQYRLNLSSGHNDINLTLIKARAITGQVVLPQAVSLADGLDVDVNANDDRGTQDWNDDINAGTKVHIGNGADCAVYTLYVPYDATDAKYIVQYNMSPDVGLAQEGYYKDPNNTVFIRDDATYVTVPSPIISNVNLKPVTGMTITGTLSLPSSTDTKPEKDSWIRVEARDSDWMGASAHLDLNEMTRASDGDCNAIPFKLCVPSNPRDGYILLYNLEFQSNVYLESAVYASDGPHSWAKGPTRVNTEGNYDFSLLKGKLISGNVSIPVEADHDITVYINAQSENGTPENGEDDINVGREVVITHEMTSGHFELLVPGDIADKYYRLSYHVEGEAGYVKDGFYGKDGVTVSDYNAAVKINAGGDDISGKNLNVLAGYEVSGKILLPEGFDLAGGGVWVRVDVRNKDGAGSSERYWVTEATTYSAIVAPGTDYYVTYELEDPNFEGIVQRGILGQDNTTQFDMNKGVPIDLSSGDISNMDIRLIGGKVLQGGISLPSGINAADDINIYVEAIAQDNTPYDGGDNFRLGTGTTIKKGQNGAEFVITVPENAAGTQYTVHYHIDQGDGYVRDMIFKRNPNGNVTFDWGKADVLDLTGGDIRDLYMSIVQGRKISGTVTLPEAVYDSLAEPLKVNIDANSDMGGTGTQVVFDKSADTGNTLEYSITVPVKEDGKTIGYNLTYWVESNPPAGLLRDGIYNNDTHTTLPRNFNAPTMQVTGGDLTGMDIALLGAKTISGNLTVSGARTEMIVNIRAWEDIENGYGTDTKIVVEAGTDTVSIPYKVTVPGSSVSNRYMVSYWTEPGQAFAQEGFYRVDNNAKGTIANYGRATPVDVSSGSREGIDLELIPGHTISGSIYIDGGYAIPPEGIKVNVNVSNSDGDGYTEGYNFAGSPVPYAITVPAGSDYTVSYDIGGQNLTGLIERAMVAYDGQGNYYTTVDWNKIKKFDLSTSDVTGVGIMLNHGRVISGRIILPGEQKAPDDIWIDISADSVGEQRSWGVAGTTVCIPKGQGGTDFELTVPESFPGSDYVINYYVNNGIYIGEMHYRDGVNGNVDFNYDKGTVVSVAGQDPALKDMELVPGYKVSGSVTLPGQVTGEVRVGINLFSDNGGTGKEIVFEPGDALTKPFEFVVPGQDKGQPKNYFLSYNINQGGESNYLREGFYGEASTSPLKQAMAAIEMNNANISGKNLTVLTGRVISGTIHMPANHPAIDMDVNAYNDMNTPSQDDDYGTGIRIHADANVAELPYSMVVPGNLGYNGYRVNYTVDPGQGYAQQGFYKLVSQEIEPTISSPSYNDATVVDVTGGDRTGIDLFLIQGTSIRGTIRLPGAETAPEGGLWVRVEAYNDNGSGASEDVFIKQGDSSADYELTLAEGTGYRLSYHLNTYTGKHVLDGYYKDDLTTLSSMDKSATIDIGADTTAITGKIITLIPGRAISGTISLPAGDPGKDIAVYLRLHADNGTEEPSDDLYLFRGPIILNNTERSVDYLAVVPIGEAGTAYSVAYETDSSSGFAEQGFYCYGATLPNDMKASVIDLSDGDIGNVNMELIPGRTISGTISLDTAAAQDIFFSIEIKDDFGNGTWEKTFIKKGDTSASYTACVPVNQPGAGYTVRYHLDQGNNGAYYENGFYRTDGSTAVASTANKMKANYVDVSTASKANVNLTVIKLGKITGTVKLPDGVNAASPITMSIMAADEDSGFYQPEPAVTVTIPAAGNSQPFELTVPVDDGSFDYKLFYFLEQGGAGYAQTGYLGSAGTAVNNAAAQAFSIAGGNKTDAVLELLPGLDITGKVKLPAGVTAGSDISVDVYAVDDSNNIYAQSSVKLLKGGSEVPYTLTAAPGTYKVTYRIFNSTEYTPGGYYSSSGTAVYSGNATGVDITAASRTGVDLTLLKTVISTPKVSPKYGTTVRIPVYINNAYKVAGIQFNLSYDKNIAVLKDIETSPMTSGFTLAKNLNQADNGIAIASMAAAQGVSGNGILCYLVFEIRGNIGATNTFNLTDSAMNNEIAGNLPFSVTIGRIKVAPVTYGNVDLSTDEKVTAADATLVLRAAAELITLSGSAKEAADVNGDGKIDTGDATLILRRVVQLIDSFPVESN